jgi:hypothetical protein
VSPAFITVHKVQQYNSPISTDYAGLVFSFFFNFSFCIGPPGQEQKTEKVGTGTGTCVL